MNDTVIHELEMLVERCVRPVRAPFENKKRMREDLLSHLTATYADEYSKSHDEPAALQRTRERFGDPAEVHRELQQSVGVHHVVSYWFEKLLARQPGESLLRLALKHLFAACLYFCVLAAVGLTLHLYKGDRNPGAMLWVFADIMIVMSLMGTFAMWVTDEMGRAMRNSDPQARRLKWCYGLLSLLFIPGMMALNYLLLGLWFGMQAMMPPPLLYLIVLVLTPVGPAAAWLLGPISAERTLYQEKWAAVEVPAD
jgi:hypothetical protein